MAPPPSPGNASNKNDDDPLGGMDPMAWLESLAARQGANPEELVTAADLDIALPPADTIIDEPGYTPGYESSKPAVKAPQPVKAAPPPPPEPQPVAASADDPLGGMDPMAWLESLAARQGANPEELVTAADLDIALPPADTIIDEPGYTPGYETSKPAVKAPEPVKAAPSPPPPPEPQPVVASADDPLGGMDPMAWLESLAARQGANPEELVTAADLDIALPPADTIIDEPGYTPGYETSKPAVKAVKAPEPEPYVPITPPPPEPQPVVASADDPLGGMDPMAWLESLAARQGANPEELVTAADLDIPVLPADTIIDEPGYMDFDVVSGSTRPMEATPAPEPINIVPPEPETAFAAPAASGNDPLGGMDPLTWLEALAARQGANREELITGGTAEIPAVDVNAVASGPGYSDYSPFGEREEITPEPTMSADEAAALLGIDSMPQPSVPTSSRLPLEAEDPLAFLHNLAATQDAGPSSSFTPDYRQTSAVPDSGTMGAESALSWLEELSRGGETQPMAPLDFDTLSTPLLAVSEPVAESGGMSDNLDEVQAWLNSQAQNLALTREALDEADQPTELPPAEAADLPDWLRQSMPQSPGTPVKPALSDEIIVPVNPDELPPWLTQPEQASSADLEQDLLAAMQSLSGPAPSVAQTPPPLPPVEAVTADVGSLGMPGSPDEIDQWAVALDEEFERRQAGDESVPDWYMEALSRAGESEPAYDAPVITSGAEIIAGPPEPMIEMPSTNVTQMERPALPQTGPLEMPDWLTAEIEEPASEIEQGDIPDWLRTMAPQAGSTPQPEAPKPGWLAELDTSALGEIPDWLEQTSPKRPEGLPKLPTVEPVAPPPPAIPVQPAPVVQRAPEPVKVAPPPPPKPIVSTEPVGDHGARLKRARELVASEQHQQSLEHYQALIDASAHLEETRGDLRALAEKEPKNPRVRRLLGDTHMRLGDLQAALDTYRSALDQL